MYVKGFTGKNRCLRDKKAWVLDLKMRSNSSCSKTIENESYKFKVLFRLYFQSYYNLALKKFN